MSADLFFIKPTIKSNVWQYCLLHTIGCTVTFQWSSPGCAQSNPTPLTVLTNTPHIPSTYTVHMEIYYVMMIYISVCLYSHVCTNEADIWFFNSVFQPTKIHPPPLLGGTGFVNIGAVNSTIFIQYYYTITNISQKL